MNITVAPISLEMKTPPNLSATVWSEYICNIRLIKVPRIEKTVYIFTFSSILNKRKTIKLRDSTVARREA